VPYSLNSAVDIMSEILPAPSNAALSASAVAAPGWESLLKMSSTPLPDGSRTCPWYDPDRLPFFNGSPPQSVYQMFLRGHTKNPTGHCIGYRQLQPDASQRGDYVYKTYQETKLLCEQVGHALRSLSINKGDKVGIYSRNNPSWMLTSYGAASQGIVTVPIYDSLGSDAAEYVINHAELSAVFVEEKNLDNLIKLQQKCPTLKHIVVMSMFEIDAAATESNAHITSNNAISFNTFLSLSSNANHPPEPITPDDLFVIMYTSGTTGAPKGVMLKHKAFIDSVGSAEIFFQRHGFTFTSQDSIMSYLPLAHIFAQQCDAFMYSVGGSVSFSQGDPKLINDDLMACKPTVFPGVPRVFARFEEKIQQSIGKSNPVVQLLFNFALWRQSINVESLQNPSDFWNALILSKVKAQILPNVRLVINGSAPLSPKTNDFLKAIFNCPVVQGFGCTETVGGLLCSGLRSKSGSVGGPLPGVYAKLVDVPEMGYVSSACPPQGELWLKAGCITHGYYRNEEATRDALIDGWLATGDIAQWNDDTDFGSLTIIDRKKNLFKLSHGEYVSPERLELEYAKCGLVSQIWVYGNSLESCLLAVVVPDVQGASKWAKERGKSEISGDLSAIAMEKEFKNDVIRELEGIRKENGFKRYEAIVDCIFETHVNDLGQGFTVENELMTPTFKFKRPQLSKKYKAELELLYANMKQ